MMRSITSRDQRDLQDVMTCIREGVKMESAGRLLEVERRTPSEAAMPKWRACFARRRKPSPRRRIFSTRIDFDLGQL